MIHRIVFGVGVFTLWLVFLYALRRTAIAAEYRRMWRDAEKPKRATSPWEEPVVRPGVYDAVERGDFDG